MCYTLPTESEESVLADLTWLGLNWDEGPDMPLAKYGPYRQSERNEIYSKLAEKLIDEGKAYPCFCTKDELEEMKARQEAEGVPTRYDGTWRDACLLYTSPSPRDRQKSRMPSSA